MRLSYLFSHIVLISVVFMLISCDDSDDQRKFEQEAMAEPSGFTETDATGEVIQEDPDDWRIGPMFGTTVDVQDPAFPNPSEGDDITINIYILSNNAVDGLLVYYRNENGYFRQLYRDPTSPLMPGIKQIRFDPIDLSPTSTLDGARGLHRIFVFDGNENLITYGDVKIE